MSTDLPDRGHGPSKYLHLGGHLTAAGVDVLWRYERGDLKSRDEIRQALIDIGLLPAIAKEMVSQMWGVTDD